MLSKVHKMIALLRKFQCIFHFNDKIYKIFVRPHLHYSDVVYGKVLMNRNFQEQLLYRTPLEDCF